MLSFLCKQSNFMKYSTSIRLFSSLHAEFEQKLALTKTLPELNDNMKKLEMYALYKQATIGVNNTSQPMAINIVGRAKWDAWSKLGDMSKEEAMKKYIQIVKNLEESSNGKSSKDLNPITNENENKKKEYQDIITTISDDGLLTITLNRPKKFNALKRKMYEEITNQLNDASENDKIRAVLINSNGPFFSSGNDLSMFTEIPSGGPEQMAKEGAILLKNFVNSFIVCSKPIVAAIQGPAFGISVTVLGLCDFVYASEKATFQTPFTSIGQSPEGCSSILFHEIMGPARANRMLLLGEKMGAKEAAICGFVSECFGSDFDIKVQEKVEKLISLPPNSMKQSKKIIREVKKKDLQEANDRECALLEKLWIGPECMEAMIKFANRKK